MNNIVIKYSDRGKTFVADIQEERNVCGVIAYDGSDFYLCQNALNGLPCSNRMGYKYSWCVDGGFESDLKDNHVSNFRIVNPEREWDEAKN